MDLLIAYDITDNKRRTRLHKCLLNFGHAVQRSVFECGELSEQRAAELHTRLAQFRLGKHDSIVIYTLCGSCIKKIKRIPHRNLGFDAIKTVI